MRSLACSALWFCHALADLVPSFGAPVTKPFLLYYDLLVFYAQLPKIRTLASAVFGARAASAPSLVRGRGLNVGSRVFAFLLRLAGIFSEGLGDGVVKQICLDVYKFFKNGQGG